MGQITAAVWRMNGPLKILLPRTVPSLISSYLRNFESTAVANKPQSAHGHGHGHQESH